MKKIFVGVWAAVFLAAASCAPRGTAESSAAPSDAGRGGSSGATVESHQATSSQTASETAPLSSELSRKPESSSTTVSTSSRRGGVPKTSSAVSSAQKEDPVMIEPKARAALLKHLDTVPEVTEAPHLNHNDRIRAVFYSGARYMGRPSRVFAYVGIPEGASAENPVPAVVLVHGGGGQAFYQWVEEWVKRGYAAIAPDTYGNAPQTREGPFVRDSLGAAPPNLTFSDINQPLENQWMYHAVSEAILAHNVLRADPRIRKDAIGITGISWGGVITTITLGIDTRFAFGVPVYGCGYLYENRTYFDYYKNEKVREYWGGEYYIPYYQTPVLWLNGDSDGSFDLHAFSRSALATRNGLLCVVPSMPHGHIEGWEPRIIYDFADMVLGKLEPQVRITKQPAPAEKFEPQIAVKVAQNTAVKSVEAYYRTAPIRYYYTGEGANRTMKFDGGWVKISGTFENGKVKVRLPEDARLYYVNINSERNGVPFTVSTGLVTWG